MSTVTPYAPAFMPLLPSSNYSAASFPFSATKPIFNSAYNTSRMKKTLTKQQQTELLQTLKARFEKHTHRHTHIAWIDVEHRLSAHPEKMWSLYQMEQTGGEPDVVGIDAATQAYLFYDCAAESPSGRRSFCYDTQALDERKENKPANSALAHAHSIGISLLTEEEYRALQQLGTFDLKTSSWILTPDAIRQLGGALFCDRRYNHVFTYHNGAQSYYAARGYRGVLKV